MARKVNFIKLWRNELSDPSKSWVLFKNGTCVILMKPQKDLGIQASSLLRKNGKVKVGSSAADFQVIDLDSGAGWVVACHHPDILTFVSPAEVSKEPDDVEVGLFGRSKRYQDARECEVLHIEDNRDSA